MNWANEFALTTELSFISCQGYTKIYTKVKNFERKKGMQVFWGIVKKNTDYCLGGSNKPRNFSSVKRGRLQCIEATIGLSSGILWFA